MPVSRFGVSLESDLLEALDEYVKLNMYPNRSQAIRHLIQNHLVDKKWKCNNIVAGAVVLIFDHSKSEVHSRISEITNSGKEIVLSVQEFFVSETKYLKIIALKGPSYKLTEFSDNLIGIKGIEHGKLIMSKVD